MMNPIIYAMWVTMFSLFMAASLDMRRRPFFFIVLSLLAAVVVLSTLSRGAIAAFAMSWLIFVFINRKGSLKVVFGGVTVIALLLPLGYLGLMQTNLGGALSMLQARIEHQELLEEDSGRIRVMKMGLELLSEPKVLIAGTGPDTMVLAYHKYNFDTRRIHNQRVSSQRSGVHNVWIKMFVEYGAVAGVLFVLVWVGALRRAWSLWKTNQEDPAAKVWGGYLLAFLIPFLIIDCSVYESAMSYHLLFPLFAILGYLVTLTATSKARSGARVYTPAGPVPGGESRGHASSVRPG